MAVRRDAVSGAWPYLRVLARLTVSPNPLDYRLSSRIGSAAESARALDPTNFRGSCSRSSARRAADYLGTSHADLACEAAAQPLLHVFGVYPWSRLLNRGIGERRRTRFWIIESLGAQFFPVMATSSRCVVMSDGVADSAGRRSARRLDVGPTGKRDADVAVGEEMRSTGAGYAVRCNPSGDPGLAEHQTASCM